MIIQLMTLFLTLSCMICMIRNLPHIEEDMSVVSVQLDLIQTLPFAR